MSAFFLSYISVYVLSGTLHASFLNLLFFCNLTGIVVLFFLYFVCASLQIILPYTNNSFIFPLKCVAIHSFYFVVPLY